MDIADAITALTDLGVLPVIALVAIVAIASMLYRRFRDAGSYGTLSDGTPAYTCDRAYMAPEDIFKEWSGPTEGLDGCNEDLEG